MDRLYPSLPQKAIQQIAAIPKHKSGWFDLVQKDVSMQANGGDCGVYSLAFATTFGA